MVKDILNSILNISDKKKELILSQINQKDISLDQFTDEILNLDFTILNSLNLEFKTYNCIVKACYEKKYGFRYNNTLAKGLQINKIKTEIISSIKKRCLLDYNKKKLILFSPTNDLSEIKRRQCLIGYSKNFLNQLSPNIVEEIKSLIVQSERKLVSNTNVVYLCDEDEIFNYLRNKFPKGNGINISIISNSNQFKDYLSYQQIRYLYTTDSKFISDVEWCNHLVSIKFDQNNIFQMFPELFVGLFEKNIEYISAVRSLSNLITLSDINVEEIDILVRRLKEIENSIITKLDVSDINDFLIFVEKKFEQKLTNMNLNGMELLNILHSNEGDGGSIINDKLVELELELIKVDDVRTGFIDFSSYPIKIDQSKLNHLLEEDIHSQEKRKYELITSFYNDFKHRESLIKECKSVLEDLDFTLALGQSFSNHNPILIKNESMFKFNDVKSRSFTESNMAVVPITYHIDRPQTILTGANSGGKTSILNLIVETHLLGMMGLFVDGNAEISLYDEMYYFKKSSGTVGSGAFEATLKSFAEINDKPNKRSLVLADEIESITEPGAASKIISATLDWLSGSGNKHIILVSHLGETLQKECPNARIDGIEAKNLDEHLELVVERNPRIGYLAKSTPQLIVERLAKKHDLPYFNFVLNKMSC